MLFKACRFQRKGVAGMDINLERQHSSLFFKLLLCSMAIGLFFQLSGKVWIQSGSARNTQVYIFLLLPALIFFINNIASRRKLELSWQYMPWIAYLCWGGLSTLWATGPEDTPFSLAKRGLFIALYLYAIFILMTQSEHLLKRAIYVGVTVIALGALVSVIYQFGVLNRPLGYRAYRIDSLGIGDFANYGWPVAAGIFHGAIATLALGFALNRCADAKRSVFWLIITVVLSVYVYFTYTRGAWFSLVASFTTVVILQKNRIGWWLLAIAGVFVMAMLVKFWPQLLEEFKHKELSGRGPIWRYYFDVMSGHWIAGHGLGTQFEYKWPNGITVSPHVHSLYFQQIYDSGIVSFLLLAGGIISISKKSIELRNNYWVRLAFPVFIFAMVAMLTDVERIYTRPNDYWTLFWLPVAILLAVPSRRVSRVSVVVN